VYRRHYTLEEFNSLLCNLLWLENFTVIKVVESSLREIFTQCWQELDGSWYREVLCGHVWVNFCKMIIFNLYCD
jgi:hypothetical protein